MRKAKSFSHIGNHAINVLARLATKKAVQEQLRADGVRVTLGSELINFSASTIRS